MNGSPALTYQVLSSFQVKSKNGCIKLSPGQLINLPAEKAEPLITDGKITTLEQISSTSEYEYQILLKQQFKLGLKLRSKKLLKSESKKLQDVYDSISEALINIYIESINAAAKRMNNAYFPAATGFFSWVESNNQQLYKEIKDLETTLSQPLKNYMPLSQFNELVRQWEDANKRAIEAYLSKDNR
jgi:hypothetical protein